VRKKSLDYYSTNSTTKPGFFGRFSASMARTPGSSGGVPLLDSHRGGHQWMDNTEFHPGHRSCGEEVRGSTSHHWQLRGGWWEAKRCGTRLESPRWLDLFFGYQSIVNGYKL
jgi:hypothetical protein